MKDLGKMAGFWRIFGVRAGDRLRSAFSDFCGFSRRGREEQG